MGNRFIRTLLVIFIMLIFTQSGISCYAADDDIDSLKGALQTTNDSVEVGILHKKIGDHYAAKNDYKTASGYYTQALSLARDRFTVEERVQIATYMSWGRELDEAKKELRLIIAGDAQNLPARVHLARVLSWSGELNEAIEVSEKILHDFPENRDAMLVKANSLRWKGHYKESIPIYRELLRAGEDFDARLGLTYALFQSGDIKEAKESRELIKPQYPYQERELQEFQTYVKAETRPSPYARYDYYNDTEDNQYSRYTLGFGFRLKRWLGRMAYVHTSASDDTRDNSENSLSVSFNSKIADMTDLRAGIGVTMLNNGRSNTFLTGSAGISKVIGNNTLGIDISRSFLTTTAELIENRVWMNNYSLSSNYRFNNKVSLNTSLGYRDYSDDNTSFDIQIAPRYTLLADNPRAVIGYRFRYLDFENDSSGGYFDPDTFVSNELFSNISYEKGKFYCYIEPYAGHQSFRRSGNSENDFFGGGYGLLGYKLQSNASIEVSAEGGNYAMSSATGFRYYMTGLRLSLTF